MSGRPVRVGVVGLGSWGREHARAWASLPGVQLAALCDPALERAEEAAAETGQDAVAFFASCDELLRSVELDAVSIVSPERDRLAVALPFFERGVHALVEKPLALTVDEATGLCEAAVAHGVLLMPGHVLRFDARFVTLKAQIAQGRLGRIRSVYARRLIPAGRHGKYSRSHPAFAAAIHDYDLARWLFESEPRRVTSHALHGANGPIPDILWSTFEFGDDGLAVVENAWVIPDGAGVWLESELEVIGSEGVAHVRIPGDALTLWHANGASAPDTSLVPFALGTSTGALRDELAYFAQCVARGRPPERVTPADGIEAVRLAVAAADAGGSKRPIDLATQLAETT